MRLTKIYTKVGDQGNTSLATGMKVSKSHERIATYGDVDELNSFVGDLSASARICQPALCSSIIQKLERVQQELFDLGGELSFPETDPISGYSSCMLSKESVLRLEKEIDRMNDELPSLKNFVLPGGHTLNAKAHICRSICRRAERSLVALSHTEKVREEVLQYINRLSDWLFVLARELSQHFKTPEILWDQTRYPPGLKKD